MLFIQHKAFRIWLDQNGHSGRELNSHSEFLTFLKMSSRETLADSIFQLAREVKKSAAGLASHRKIFGRGGQTDSKFFEKVEKIDEIFTIE